MMSRLALRGSAYATVGLAAGAFVCVVVACSSPGGDASQGASHPTSGTASGTASAPSTETVPGAGGTAEATAETTVSGVGTADSIKEPPDGGVVMNNAQTSVDAGSSDRLDGIKTVVLGSRDKFRACFDTWAKANASGKEVNVLLEIKLAPDGAFISGAFDPAKTELVDKTAESCMVDVAKSLTYPASPKGMETTYRHPFVFKVNKSGSSGSPQGAAGK